MEELSNTTNNGTTNMVIQIPAIGVTIAVCLGMHINHTYQSHFKLTT